MKDAIELYGTDGREITYWTGCASGDRLIADNTLELLRSLGFSKEELATPISEVRELLKSALEELRHSRQCEVQKTQARFAM